MRVQVVADELAEHRLMRMLASVTKHAGTNAGVEHDHAQRVEAVELCG